MKLASTSQRRSRRCYGILIGIFLLAVTARAFYLKSSLSYLIFLHSLIVAVNGPPGGRGPVVLQNVNFGTPGIVQLNSMLPLTGNGTVSVHFTAINPGTTTVNFSGTYNGSWVGTSMTIIVPPASTSTAQNPFVGIGGDPINTSTGEYFGRESVDLNLGGPMPLIFERYVASKLAGDGVVDGNFGQNRMHNYSSKITSTGTMIKQVVLPNGRLLTFQKTGTKWNLQDPLDVPFVLLESGTNFLLGDPHTKQIWTYNNTGQLTKIEDGKGNAHTLTYTGTQLTSVSDGLGRTLTLAYASDRIVSVTDHTTTRQVTFGYTGNVLTSSTDYGGHVTTYGESGGLPTSVTRPVGNTLFTQVYTGGKVTSQVERGTDTSTLNYGVGTTTFTDPTLETLVDNYGADGRLISHADEAGKQIAMSYDSAGRRSMVTDRLGDKTTTVYHALSGLPATITNAEGKSTIFTYGPRTLSGIVFQYLIKIVYPDTAARSFTYDTKGNITQITDEAGKIWKYTFNTRGQVLTVTNPLLGVTTYTYDANGNLATSQEPDQGATTYTYDARFRLTQITRPDTSTVVIAYDTKDRITSITDERGKVVTYAYDNNDRVTMVTDPDGNDATYAYDLLDRVQSVTDRRGKTGSMTYNSRHARASTTDRNGNVTTYQYDARQRPISTTDAGGHIWTRQFDDEDLLTGVANPVDPPSLIKRNHLGQVVEISDPLGNTSHLLRDAMQRVTMVFDPLGRQTNYAYDKRGLLISATEQGIGAVKYDRDGLGNVIKITDPNAGAWSYTFLKSGRLSTMIDPLLKKWIYTYDIRGRLASITYPDSTKCTFSYDASGNLTGRQFTSGLNLPSAYDDVGRLESVDGVDFSYDAEGNLTNAAQNGQNFNATYDDDGRLTSVSYMSGGITVDYQYDSRNRLIQVSDTKSMVDIDFAYDNAGRLTGMTRTPGVDAAFTYDTAGRLVHINEAAVMDLQYTLTPAGEVASVSYSAPLIPSVTASTQSFLFGKAGQITTPGYTYDARGRLTAAPAGVTYAWDAAARLTNANGVTLAYNGLGDVTTRADGSGVTRFYNHYALGMAPIVYEDPPAGSDRAYVWTPEGSLLYSVDMGTGAPTFYHFDRTGSTLALTDATDMVTDSYAYGPYGEPMGHTGASTQPFQYIGAYGVRAEGSLYQMRARYYDPKTARFISRDPLGPRLGDAKSANPYVYASQNPMRYIDPAGNYSQPINRFFIHSGYGYPSHSGWTVLHRRHRWVRSRWPCAAGDHWGSPTWSDLAPPPPCGGDIFGRPPGYGGTCVNDFLGGYPFPPFPGGSSFPPAPNSGSSGEDVFISGSFGKPEFRDTDGIFGLGGNTFGSVPISDEAGAPQPQSCVAVSSAQNAHLMAMIAVYQALQGAFTHLSNKFADSGYNSKTIRDQMSAVDKQVKVIRKVIEALGGTPPTVPQ